MTQLCFFGMGGAAQPLHNEDKSLCLVCNGEIYNHEDLRQRLGGAHRFAGRSDCEVILHLYEEIGLAFTAELQGQFAFLLWDAYRDRLVVGRDPAGICPLFWRRTQDGWWFASEAKALLAAGRFESLDPGAIAETVALYGPTPPRTCLSGVNQVAPGDVMLLHRASEPVRVRTNPLVARLYPTPVEAPADGVSRLEQSLLSAVRRTLQGDSTPAVYLSGGIDSALVAALLCRQVRSPLALSLQFDDPRFDEREHQQAVVHDLGLDHRPLRVTEDRLLRSLPVAVWRAEVPLTRGAPVGMMLLADHARQEGVRCVLSGEGADELFAGYPVFATHRASVQAKRSFNDRLLGLLRPEVVGTVNPKVHITARCVANTTDERIRAAQRLEVETKLTRYLLAAQGDRASQGNTIEQRFPFLDNEVVAVAADFPPHSLKPSQGGKAPLRTIARKLLPRAVADRPKQGYLTPDEFAVRGWRGQLRPWRDLLNATAIERAGCLRTTAVRDLLKTALEPGAQDDPFVQSGLLLCVSVQMAHALFVEGARPEDFV